MHNSNLLTIPKAVYHAYPPQDLAWPLDQILDTVWQNSQLEDPAAGRRITIFAIGNVSGFNRGMLSYFAMQRTMQSDGEQSFLIRGGGADNVSVQQILDFPYLLVKIDDVGYGMQDFQSLVDNALRMKPVRYAEIANFPLPDGTDAILYRRIKPTLADLASQGQFEQLASILELSPNDPQLLRFLAEAQAQAGLAEQAQVTMESLAESAGDAQALIKSGDLYRQQGQLEQTEQQYRQAIDLEPANADAWLALGELYASQSLPEKTVQAYLDGLAANPDSVALHLALGDLYGAQASAEPADVKGQQAEAEYRAVLDLEPTNLSAIRGLGRLFRQQQRWQEAESIYKMALDRVPSHADLWRDLGNTYYESQQVDLAIGSYQKTLELAPNRLPVRIRLAQLFQQAGQPEQAVELWQQALEAAPEDSQSWRYLADLYRSIGRIEEAIAAYNTALVHDGTNVAAHTALAQIYQNQGDCEDALVHLAERARLRNTSEDFATLGAAYRDCGDLERAVEVYQQAAALNPQSAATQLDLGRAYQAAGMSDKAILAWQAVLELAPDSKLSERAQQLITESQGQ